MFKNFLVLALLKHELQNQNVSLKYALVSTQYSSFNTLSMVQRNTPGDSSNHGATTNVTREVYPKTAFSAACHIHRNLI
jgi:hypothetical protein